MVKTADPLALKQLLLKRAGDKAARQPTTYEQRVYQMILAIPSGSVTTYGELARALGSSSRAVGQALRRNPFAPEVPCHRIVRTSLDVGGYSGSQGDTELVRKKLGLLREEGVPLKGTIVASGGSVVRAAELLRLAGSL